MRLNEPEYDGEDFAARGLAHHDLEFEDCTPPPEPLVAAFLRLAAGPGALAVRARAEGGRGGGVSGCGGERECVWWWGKQ